MNAIAAEPGWRNLAIWALPPVAYALASDTLIGVVRARALARHHPHHPGRHAATPLAILGGLLLWLLRLALAPASTLSGFRAWVLDRVPGRPRPPRPEARAGPAPHPGKATKTARFLDLVTERHGSGARRRAIAGNWCAGIREVERYGQNLPEGSYGRRNRQAIAARETRIAARLRAVERA